MSRIDPQTRRYLRLLRRHGQAVATWETACNPVSYATANGLYGPLYLHCAAMAVVVKATCGGDIVQGRIDGKWSHYWNRLPNGVEVDLTSCQFSDLGGDGWHPLKKGRRVSWDGRSNLRFLLFAERISERLKNGTAKEALQRHAQGLPGRGHRQHKGRRRAA